MAVGNRTVGGQTSDFPTSIKSFTAQTESNDPASEDPDLAEGRDANAWSAALESVQAVLGASARGLVEVTGGGTPTADIGAFVALIDGAQVSYAGTTGLSLTDGATNYIYYNVATAAVEANTTGFPTLRRMIPLAKWDDSGGAETLTDERPAHFGPHKTIFGSSAEAGSGGDGEDVEIRAGVGDGAGSAGVVKMPDPFGKGSAMQVEASQEAVSGSGGTLTSSGLFPAGCIKLGVVVKVLVGDSGGGSATDMDIGDGTDVDAYGAGVAISAGTTTDLSDHTDTGLPSILTSAEDVVLTANGGTFDSIGVQIVAHYLTLASPA